MLLYAKQLLKRVQNIFSDLQLGILITWCVYFAKER